MRKLQTKELNRGNLLGLAGFAMGLAALFVSLSGLAGAAPTQVIVHKGDIAPGAVTAKSLAKGAVTAKKIRKDAVTAPKLAENAVTTPKLAEGAVQGRNLAGGAVTAQSLGKEVVGTAALARNAVTASQLAPGSVYGGALGTQTLVTTPIADLDVGAHNIEWTASNTEAALCGPGEALLGSGFAFTNPGNGAASFLQALPILNGATKGVTGRITTDAGGSASGVIAALCLK
jgi:hypothetical protein